MWTDIILEGYCCCRNIKQCPKKVVVKKHKLPSFRKGKRGWVFDECSKPITKKLTPEFWCLNNKCKYFGYCDAVKKAYLHMNKFYKE